MKMTFEEELKDIFKSLTIKEELLLKQGNIKDYNHTEYPELKELIARNFNPYIEDVHLNAMVLVKHLDKLLQFTSLNCLDWIEITNIYIVPGFLKKLATELHNFSYDYKLIELLIRMSTYSGLKKEFFTDEIITSYILSCKTKKACKSYYSLFNYLTPHQKTIFLKKLIENRISFDITQFDINFDECYLFVSENIEYILPLLTNITDFIQQFKYNEKVELTINNYYDNHKDELIKSIMGDICFSNYNNGIVELIELIIQDISHNENAKATDFAWLNSGSYCNVLRIKDKILKFGNKRMTPTFPNNPMIIKPLLRKTFNIDNQSIFIEVTEKANIEEYFSNDDLYEVHKRLRKLGLVCVDLSKNNIGRLTKPNTIHWNGNISLTDELLELEPYIHGDELKEGDLVLIDGDGIFRDDDPKLKEYKGRLWTIFEEKYQLELKNRRF